MPENVQKMKKWISAWNAAAVSLKQIKKKELRASGYYDRNRQILEDMLQYACDHAKPRLKTGLEEQQRLFLKIRRKKP